MSLPLYGLPKLSVDPALYLPLWRGTFLDHSGNGNVVSVVGSPNWISSGGIVRFAMPSGSRISVADAAILRGDTWTVFIHGTMWDRFIGTGMVFQKRDAGSSQLEIRKVSATRLGLAGGTSVVDWNPTPGTKNICVVAADGETPRLYVDGAFYSEFNTSISVVANTAPVSIGGHYAGGLPSGSPNSLVLAYPGTLSADEISQLHVASDQLRSPMLPYDRRYFDTAPKAGPGANVIGAWNPGEVRGGQIADESGDTHHLTVSGAVAPVETPLGRAADMDTNGQGKVAPSPTVPTSGSLEIVYAPKSTSSPASGVIFEAADGTRRLIVLRLGTSLRFGYYDGATMHPASIASALAAGRLTHMVITWSGSTINVYLDGVLQTAGASVPGTSGVVALAVGSQQDDTLFEPGTYVAVRLLDVVLTSADAQARYLEFAKQQVYEQDFTQVPPTVSNVGAGAVIPGTDYTVESGTFKVGENSDGEKYLECVTAGHLTRPSSLVEGTFEFELYKGVATNQPVVSFVSSDRTRGALAGGYAYGIQMNIGTLARILCTEKNGGGPFNNWYTDTGYVATDSVRYRFRTTRSREGIMTVYIKGGTFTDWTVVDTTGGMGSNPFTDTTITESSFMVFDLGSGDRIYLDRQYYGVVAP